VQELVLHERGGVGGQARRVDGLEVTLQLRRVRPAERVCECAAGKSLPVSINYFQRQAQHLFEINDLPATSVSL
jgi:hypothetical protein